MLIIGAGLSGLIAAQYFRRHKPIVIERQDSLPNNHHALLRFRGEGISRITGIPFEKVQVRKQIIYEDQVIEHPNVHMCNMYSLKVTGRIIPRSIWDLAPVDRYIAPPDFISQLAEGVDIRYDTEFDPMAPFDPPIISTIPLPILANQMGMATPSEAWGYKTIWAIKITVKEPICDIYQTIYYPHLIAPQYRASFCGNELIIECTKEPMAPADTAKKVLLDFGIPYNVAETTEAEVYEQQYGKIVPVDDATRRNLIFRLTQNKGIYSLGRFATWRQILLDDLANDLQVIERFTESYDDYMKHIKKG
jgi:hypothetical protein